MYRQLQVLYAIYNHLFAQFFWPFFIVTNVSLHVLFVVISVQANDSLEFIVLAFLVTWSVALIPLELAIYTLQGQIYEQSQKHTQMVKTILGKRVGALLLVGVNVGGI